MSFPWEASLGKQGVVHSLHSARQQAHRFFLAGESCLRCLPLVWGKVLSNSESGTNLRGGRTFRVEHFQTLEVLAWMKLLNCYYCYCCPWDTKVGLLGSLHRHPCSHHAPRRLLRGSSSNTQHHQGGTISFHWDRPWEGVGLMLSPGNMTCRPCPPRSSTESCVKWVGVGQAQREWFGIFGKLAGQLVTLKASHSNLATQLMIRRSWLPMPTCQMCRFRQ